MRERLNPSVFDKLKQGKEARTAQIERARLADAMTRKLEEEFEKDNLLILDNPEFTLLSKLKESLGKILKPVSGKVVVPASVVLLTITAACSSGEEKTEKPQEFTDQNPKIAFHSERDGNTEIYVINPDGSGLKNITNSPDRDDFFPNNSWSPDGSQLVYMSRESGETEEDKQFDIFVVDRDGKNRRQLTDHPADDIWPIWSPDGKQIVFISERDGNSEIYVIKPDGSGLENLTNYPATDGIFTLAWSPDSERIAFTSDRGGINDLYTMKSDGSDIKLHAKGDLSEHILDLYWSPDGKYIAFEYMITMVGNEIFIVDVEKGGFVQITKDVSGVSPSWSPDSSLIVFHSGEGSFGSDSDIYVINPRGNNLVNLTENNPDFNGFASWSPDGKRIAFTSDRDGNNEIYIMDVDGSNPIRLTNNPAEDSVPAWFPMNPEREH